MISNKLTSTGFILIILFAIAFLFIFLYLCAMTIGAMKGYGYFHKTKIKYFSLIVINFIAVYFLKHNRNLQYINEFMIFSPL